MPNPTLALDPASSLRLSEIDRRAQLASTPIQFASSIAGGLQAGKAVQDIQDQNEKKQKAAQFEQILQQGLPAMQQAWKELSPEDQQKVPDPQLFTDSREAVTSWWGLATEAHSRAQVAQSLSAGNYDEAAGAAAGLTKDPTSLINTGREQASKDKAAQAKADKEAALSQKFATLRGQASTLLQKNKGKLNPEDINLILDKADPELNGYEPFNKWADNLKKQQVPAFSTPNSMSEDEMNFWAGQYAQGKADPAFLASLFSSRGGNKAQMLGEITRRAQGINPDVSISQDIAGQASAKDQKNRRTVAAIDNAKSRIDEFTKLSDSIDRTQFPTLNKWIQSGKKGSGDVKSALAKLSGVLMSDELTQVFANGAGGSDMQRKMSSELADPNLSPEQFKADMDLLKNFLDTRRSTFTNIMGRYAQPEAGAPAGQPAAAGGAPGVKKIGRFQVEVH